MAEPRQQECAPAQAAFWRRPAFRAALFQTLLVLALCLVGYSLFTNTLNNLEQRGISTGFGFLSQEAGFGILQSLIDYNETHSYGRTFFVGLLNTLLVSALGIALATLIGFVMGVARLSGNWLVARIATVYIETFRNIPLLLQIMFWYFAVLQPLPRPKQSLSFGEAFFLNNRGFYIPGPVFEQGFWLVGVAFALAVVAVVILARWARRRQEATGRQFHTVFVSLGLLLGLPLLAFLVMGMPMSWEYPALKGFNFRGGMVIIPELAALLLALSIYTGAFIAEAVRSGILAVSHGQTEAAYALGLRPGVTLRLVIIPQALRVIIPQLTSQYLNLTKNSSLATAIGYPDLVAVFAGTTLNQTGQAVEVIAMTMAVYLTISLSISLFMNWYNKRKQLVER
ncbi:MAG: amino acid ABC transporter permease [Candidatus Sedimenticola endophacoides]|uniref:Amino acid ABC transporter permease n=1 Tax=Candidatus Sedimenticola endophacoides TaxID=2548426 RepID=A0A657Q5K5_9GAMM|nr:MAG: amino acid ABC transporter permease [Candidatus Sedimenticola endophacoides]OQX35053.1 MAG: amino acid ABC transporter permease [Candidatus Sedimenticola endophacoides]OQX40394.1 MAG: amino acid ABC transporter permease [Candidatus Sedimenticola endophacoides]OQX44228.1 MAG: amino acid ABC transporter permease [Candidatus Sedimenticola endophacoides]OQX48397.1 MAG: amino acid ABC transporter permease [Candidatus Sedimenticola endophacoides]